MSLFDITEGDEWVDPAAPALELIVQEHRRCVECETTWRGSAECFLCGRVGRRHHAEALPGSWVFTFKENDE